MAKDGPNKVVQSTRQVIERKLLTALDDPDTVAILASRRDLNLLISILTRFAATRKPRDSPRTSDDAGEELRAKELSLGLEQLRREAFGGD